ncbi:MAG: nucleotidyl transferase AbiEii/AbiGii toxin family protein [Actinobacteria bacterium]|nr:nucleotidyl transferase AbiEii/AbiGii toxin family protein [Actinomycetota bacterium]
MSGEPIVLQAPAVSVTAQLVGMLDRLPNEGLPTFCVVGGLAVLCRVGTLYRATADVDTVIEDSGAVVASLRDRPDAVRTPNGVEIGGTKIDVIEVGEIPDASLLPDDISDRMFVLSHRYAYDTREQVHIDVIDPGQPPDVITTATCEMATPAALVAMKLQSYPRRRGPSIAKQGSDLLDLYALLHQHDHDREIADALANGHHDLGELAAELAQELLVDDAEVAAGRVRRYTATQIDPEALRHVASRFVQQLRA